MKPMWSNPNYVILWRKDFEAMQQENKRLQDEISKWVNLAMACIAANEESLLTTIKSGLFDDDKLAEIRSRR